jgi:hypothetical protein
MEYLGGCCIKNQTAKNGLEELRRQSLTQTLYSSKLGEFTGQGAAQTLKVWPSSSVGKRQMRRCVHAVLHLYFLRIMGYGRLELPFVLEVLRHL